MSSKTFLTCLETSDLLGSNLVCAKTNYFWCILRLKKSAEFLCDGLHIPLEILLKMCEMLVIFAFLFWILRAFKSLKTYQMSSKTFLTCLETSNLLGSNLVCAKTNYFWCILRLKKSAEFLCDGLHIPLEILLKKCEILAIFAIFLAFAGV